MSRMSRYPNASNFSDVESGGVSQGVSIEQQSQHRSQQNAALGLFAAFVLAVLLPLSVASTGEVTETSSTYVLPLGVMVLAGWQLAWLLGGGKPHPYSIVTWAFPHGFEGLVPTPRIRLDRCSSPENRKTGK
jgi:hypothetical protein